MATPALLRWSCGKKESITTLAPGGVVRFHSPQIPRRRPSPRLFTRRRSYITAHGYVLVRACALSCSYASVKIRRVGVRANQVGRTVGESSDGSKSAWRRHRLPHLKAKTRGGAETDLVSEIYKPRARLKPFKLGRPLRFCHDLSSSWGHPVSPARGQGPRGQDAADPVIPPPARHSFHLYLVYLLGGGEVEELRMWQQNTCDVRHAMKTTSLRR